MAFHILVDPEQVADVNFALNGYDLVVLDEASLVSHCTFLLVASTLNCLNNRPIVLVAGDKCQQQPLQTVDGKVSNTISILSNGTFTGINSINQACTVPAVQSGGPALQLLSRSDALDAAHSGSSGRVPGGGRPLPSCTLEDEEIFTAFSHKH